MAAIAIPLITEALPILTQLITNLISHVMNTLGPGHPALHSTVSQSLQPILQQLIKDGKLPANIDPKVLSGVIETLIQQMAPSAPAPTVPIPSPMPDVILGDDASQPQPVPSSVTSPTGPIKFVVSGSLTLTPQ